MIKSLTKADTLDKVAESMIAVYQEKTKLNPDEIELIMKNETWLTAAEAVAKGFADVIEDTQIAASINKNELIINGQSIDISKYKNFNAGLIAKTEELGNPHCGDADKTGNQPNNKTVVSSKTTTKGNNTMNVKALCEAAGLDFEALLAAGMDEESIKALAMNKLSPTPATPAKTDDGGAKAEKQRTDDILKLGSEYKAQDLAVKFVQEGKTVESFKDELLKLQGGDGQEPTKAKRTTAGTGMTEDEARNFSFLNLINAMVDPTNKDAQKRAEKEFEACGKAAEKYGVKNNGMVIPIEAMITPLMPKATAGTLDTTGGASLIPTTLLTTSFIELLRNNCIALQLARQLTGLAGNVDIPRQTAGTSAYWLGEDEEVTSSNPTFDDISLVMKTVGGRAFVTRKMLKLSSLDMEAFVRQDLAKTLALAIDKAMFYGSGTKQPIGIKLTSGINSKTFAGANPTYAEFVEMETKIGADNAAVESMAYIINSTTRGHCKTTQKFPDDANTGGVILEPGNTINGYKTMTTNQIEIGDVFLGNFDDLILGMWGGIELIVDPYTYSSQGKIQITAFQDIDLGVRHPESFCYGVKASA